MILLALTLPAACIFGILVGERMERARRSVDAVTARFFRDQDVIDAADMAGDGHEREVTL